MLIPLGDEDSHRQVARDVERERPGWIVVWGVYSRRYWAYPLFNVPPRTIVNSTDPRDLVARMTRVELSVPADQRPSAEAPAAQAPESRPPGSDRSPGARTGPADPPGSAPPGSAPPGSAPPGGPAGPPPRAG